MGLTTIVQTIDDLDVSPGSGYSAAFLHSFEQPGSAATFVETAQGPVVTHVAAGMYRLSALSIYIEEGDAAVMQAEIMRALDTTRAAKSIVVSDTDGENRRYLMFVTEAVNQLPESAGLGYIATLLAHEDIRWRSETDVTQSHTFTASGQTWVMTVGGHLQTVPTITVTPRAPKSAPGWQYAKTQVVRWRSPISFKLHVPIEITGGGWNTAALVTAGEMTNRTNIAVLDGYGRVVPHWYGAADGAATGFNSTTTKIWINTASLFVPHAALYIGEDLDADSTSMNIYIDTEDETAIPTAGWLRFADTGEIISFNGVERGMLMEVRRGVAGTTRADHVAGEELEGGIRPFQIVWDPVSTVRSSDKTPAYQAAALKEPLIDKAASTNSFWRMTRFRDGGRTVAWSYGGVKELAFTTSTAVSGARMGFAEPWTAMGFRHDIRGHHIFYQMFPMPISRVRITGRKYDYGYLPGYPASAQLLVISSATRAYDMLWDSGQGEWDPAGVAFDETLDTPMWGMDGDPANWTLYNELLWRVLTTNCQQTDIQQVDVTFKSPLTPIVESYTPTTTYDLDMLLVNSGTGEAGTVQSLRLFMPGLEIDKGVVINALDHTVIYAGDNSNKYAACRKTQGDGAFLMTLQPGDNAISVLEEHLAEVDVDFRYSERRYV